MQDKADRLQGRPAILLAVLSVARAFGCESGTDAAQPCADFRWPELLGAQYTYVRQSQTRLVSPYQGRLSLHPDGDTQSTHTIGLYLGWAMTDWAQVYLDTEKFMGAGDSGAVGLGGLTNGDVVREGGVGLPKVFYIAREYLRLMLPLGPQVTQVERAQDQIGGAEAAMRLELKFGELAASDDFDHNRYAGSTRTQFMNWSLWDNTAWDYAADTRGYTYGIVVGFVSPAWSLKYGAYLMPTRANGQTLENAPLRARGDNLELTLSPWSSGSVLRLLAYRNTARMGDYREALAIAAMTGSTPDIVADDREGRHKYGFGINFEQPLADEGESGIFGRLGWDDGRTESFAFTEVDRLASFGGQLSGRHWDRAEDHAGVAVAIEGLSAPHRDYLAAGGAGFLLGDGALNYASERILEVYYRIALPWPLNGHPGFFTHYPLKMQLSPDFQYIRNPGFNQDRGPVRFWGLRLHLEL
ncbi:MAG TPA: carbohydrate porin [Steroidobacteraceae bacterium]|nr:carbohydrate porin [Steroidobacteraceae bacterium]